MALAGFTVGEAEGLRRAMSRKRSRRRRSRRYRGRFVAGAAATAVDARDRRTASTTSSSASRGSASRSRTAAAFALLAYQSAWLRHYYPAEFLCALMNAQPMGFYPPSSLVRDGAAARGGGAPAGRQPERARCAPSKAPPCASGSATCSEVGEDEAEALVAARGGRPFADVRDLAQRAPLAGRSLEALVAAGACDSFGASRRALLWELGLVPRAKSVRGSGGDERQLALPLEPTAETPELPEQTVWERMLADYRHDALASASHPLELLRPHLPPASLASADLPSAVRPVGVAVAGMAIARQRPATANGVVFMLLEDEHGQMNLIVPPPVYDRHRAIVRGEPLVLARGMLRAGRPQQNVVVCRARDTRPARPPGLERLRRPRRAAECAPLRAPLARFAAAPWWY